MQTLIKVSNRAKWYFVKLTSPLTSFKNWFLADIKQTFAELNNNLDNRVENLERVSDLGDIERRLEDLEYYDLYDIQERAENAERKAEDNDTWIESIKERSETNQESIKNLKNDIDYCKEFIVDTHIENVSYEKFNKLLDRVASLENSTAIQHVHDDLNRLENCFKHLDERLETFDSLEDRVDNLQELAKKYLNAELEAVALKQEKTEANLSAMQKLTFEICKYYGGDFNLDDFNNCYDIIKKYDVKEGK